VFSLSFLIVKVITTHLLTALLAYLVTLAVRENSPVSLPVPLLSIAIHGHMVVVLEMMRMSTSASLGKDVLSKLLRMF